MNSDSINSALRPRATQRPIGHRYNVTAVEQLIVFEIVAIVPLGGFTRGMGALCRILCA
jgi:hypothetical protein